MVKITTKQQFELLIEQMEANPNVARGVRSFGESRATTDQVWAGIAEKLNSIGPPLRTPEEWARVWVHYKAKLKKKMAQNKKSLYITGGGPSEEISLSILEQAASNLLQMGLSVNPPGNLFGTDIEVEILECDISIEKQAQLEESIEPEVPLKKLVDSKEKKPTPVKPIKMEKRKFNLLEEQTGVQSELLVTIKKIEETVNKKYEILKEIKELKRTQIDVLKEMQNIKKMK